MDLTAIGVFSAALLIAAASPGPGIIALVARVIGAGTHGAGAFAAGMIAGDLVWLGVAVLGLAAIAHVFGEIFLVIKFGGAAYLLYLAWKMWTAPAQPATVEADCHRDSRLRLFLGGLSVALGNPKVIAFYLALVPNLIDIARVGLCNMPSLLCCASRFSPWCSAAIPSPRRGRAPCSAARGRCNCSTAQAAR